MVGEVVGYIAAAIDATTQPELRKLLEDKVLDYFKQNTPIHAIKASSKIIHAMLDGNPHSFPRFFTELLDTDVKQGHCSYEKTAFRLRLIGGMLKCSMGLPATLLSPPILNTPTSITYFTPAAVLSNLLPFFRTYYTQHTEKKMRKAVWKVAKETLRGFCSFYPTNTFPYDTTGQRPIGAPNSIASQLVMCFFKSNNIYFVFIGIGR